MDFLTLLLVYCVLLIISVLCLLYRDAAILNTGVIGHVRQFVIQSLDLIVPGKIQEGLYRLCSYLLYKRNNVFQVLFVVLAILGHAVWVVDMLPILYKHYPDYNHTFWPLVFIFVNYFCWHKAWTGDPGEINMRNVGNYCQIYEHDELLYLSATQCRTCNLPKPARSKHCSTCNRCVHRFDHHCIWTNNCVGALNNGYFILFMGTLLAVFVQGIYVGGGCVMDYAHDIRLFNASYLDDDDTIHPITISVAIQHLFMALPRLVFLIVALVILVILLGLFFSHHLYLVFTNQSTNERYKLQDLEYRQQSTHLPSSKESQRAKQKQSANRQHKENKLHTVKLSHYRPYSRGVINNLMEVFLPHNFIVSQLKNKQNSR